METKQKSQVAYSIVITNVILQCHFWWIDWLMRTKLSGNLGSEMSAEVILTKYDTVCARFAVWVAFSNLTVIVLVNAVLVGLYFVFKKRNMQVAGGGRFAADSRK